MPSANDIRRRIAEAAAADSGKGVDYYLDLIGEVEPSMPLSRLHEASWRLSSYHGDGRDGAAIERAVAKVHRTFPFMDGS